MYAKGEPRNSATGHQCRILKFMKHLNLIRYSFISVGNIRHNYYKFVVS